VGLRKHQGASHVCEEAMKLFSTPFPISQSIDTRIADLSTVQRDCFECGRLVSQANNN